jgi:elongation factor Ts
MSIDAKTVKELRDRTGAGMMDCKRALSETDGDLDAAVALLREKGLASAAKKAGRVAAEGLVGVFASADGSEAVVVELNCETDFVAKNDAFGDLLETIGNALLDSDADEGTGESAGDLTVGSKKLSEVLTDAVASIGENIGLRRFMRVRAGGGRVGSYVHAGGKIGVLVELSGASEAHDDLARSLAMQVAAAMPRHVRRDEVPEAEVAAEREIFKNQALASGKPEQVVEKIVDGKVDKFFREICLVEQEYVRDSQLTVEKLLAQSGKETGSELRLERFVRYQLGEGIEKKESNLAAEVAEQLGKST